MAKNSGPRFGNVSGPVQTGEGNQMVAGGDQFVAGGDQSVVSRSSASSADVAEQLAEIQTVLHELAGLRLTAAERESVERSMAGMEQSLTGTTAPDPVETARHLQSAASVLKEAGALASAGSSLTGAFVRLAKWLGPVGAGVLAMI